MIETVQTTPKKGVHRVLSDNKKHLKLDNKANRNKVFLCQGTSLCHHMKL